MPYKVLIADDEPIIRFGLSSCIDWETSGLSLIGEAANGEAALAVIEREGVDILITDIKMPIMDGLELVREVKKRIPEVKVILVSSYSDFEYAREAVKLGVVVDYLLKPTMEPEDLSRMLQACKEKLDAERDKAMAIADMRRDQYRERLHGFESRLKAYISGADSRFDWMPEWAEHELMLSVWKLEGSGSTATGEVLHKLVVLEQAARRIDAWCSSGSALITGEEELIVLLASRNNGGAPEIEAMQQRIYREEGLRFTVGISPEYHRLGTSREAYGWAKLAMNQAFFDGEGKCYRGTIASGAGRHNTAAQEALQLREQFSRAYASSQQDACMETLGAYMQLWKRKQLQREEIVAHARSLMIMVCSHQLQGKSEDAVQQLLAKLDEIEKLPTLEQVSACIHKEIERLWEPERLSILPDDRGGTHVIQLALSYIQEHYRRDISLQEVAEYVHMSKNYFSEQFKRRTGLNFIDFVIRLRIHYAKHLLDNTSMKVQEIGYEAGFNSPKHFLKLFKRLTRCTPAEYRQRRSQQEQQQPSDSQEVSH